MKENEKFREMALAFDNVTEQPHFEKISFRYKKKIFATLDTQKQQACIRLTPIEQSVFTVYDKEAIFPVPNKWGQLGWTFIALQKVREDMLRDALETAYKGLSGKKPRK